MGTVHFQEFISLKLRNEEGNVEMIKDYQSFHQSNIFIKMANSTLILLRMSDSNYPHMDKLRFMLLMVNYHIRMYISELNDEDYPPPPPITELEDDENEKVPGDDGPTEYLSDDEDVSNTEDGIPYQDKKRLGGKILSVWERYKPLLKNYYFRTGYMMSMNSKKYAHSKVSVLYTYVNYHAIF